MPRKESGRSLTERRKILKKKCKKASIAQEKGRGPTNLLGKKRWHSPSDHDRKRARNETPVFKGRSRPAWHSRRGLFALNQIVTRGKKVKGGGERN